MNRVAVASKISVAVAASKHRYATKTLYGYTDFEPRINLVHGQFPSIFYMTNTRPTKYSVNADLPSVRSSKFVASIVSTSIV